MQQQQQGGNRISFGMSYNLGGKADLTMILNGALAGLVAITADPLSPSPVYSVIIGGVAGVIVVFSIIALDKVKIDDPVGAISVHGVCGFFGLMVVPVSNADAAFTSQLFGAAVIFAWVFFSQCCCLGSTKSNGRYSSNRRGRN